MITSIIGGVIYLLTALISIFPDSPIDDLLLGVEFGKTLNYVNWFVPIRAFQKVFAVWIGVVTVYYLDKQFHLIAKIKALFK